jgi:hypothetical protein
VTLPNERNDYLSNINQGIINTLMRDLTLIVIRGIAFLLLVLFGFSNSVIAQDVLVLKSGTELKVNIIEESTDLIKYREFDNPSGPLYSIAKDKVASVKYKKGSKNAQETSVRETEKPAANTAPQATRSGLLTAKRRNVYLDGIMQNSRGVRLLMEDQPEALISFEKGKRLISLSNSCAFGVMITSFVFSQKVNKKETSEEKIRAGMPGLVIDGGFIIAAIIMSSSGKSKIRNSVTLYNSSLNKPVSYKLDLGLQENGVGLALKF